MNRVKMSYNNPISLVTGATGMVGSFLLLELLTKGRPVRALRRGQSSMKIVEDVFRIYMPEEYETYLEKIHWVEGDLTDVYSLYDAMEGVSDVYHCAGVVSYSQKDLNRLLEVNGVGTANMVNAAIERGIRKFCYVSSIAALGRPTPLLDERSRTEKDFFQFGNPITGYGYSKYLGEQEVWRAFEEGLDVVIVNPSIILGYGDENRSSTQLFTNVRDGQRFYTHGKTGFVDVRDVVKIMIELVDSDISGERFILNGINLHYKEIFDLIATAFNVSPPGIMAKPWLGEIYWRCLSFMGFFTGKSPLVTAEVAKMAYDQNTYSNEKICNALKYQFIPIANTVSHVVSLLKKEPRSEVL